MASPDYSGRRGVITPGNGTPNRESPPPGRPVTLKITIEKGGSMISRRTALGALGTGLIGLPLARGAAKPEEKRRKRMAMVTTEWRPVSSRRTALGALGTGLIGLPLARGAAK